MTPFLATLTQRGTSFSGTIIEPDLHRSSSSAEATIIGVIAGDAVDFTKTYRRSGWGYKNPVDYVGQLIDKGQRVTGVWSLLEWNGTFEMTRRSSAEAEEEREEAVTVER